MKKLLLYIGFALLLGCSSTVEKTATATSSDSVEINYQVRGNGNVALVFVHGWCIDQSYWEHQQTFSKGYTMVTLDLAGHGKSGDDRNQWTVNRFSDDVVSVVEVLDLKKVILIGHSMGGDIVLDAALKMPERVIGLIGVDNFKDASFSLSDAVDEQIHSFLNQIRSDYLGTAEGFTKQMLFIEESDSSIVQRVLTDVQSADPGVSVAILENLFMFAPQEKSLLPKLKVPLYLINSDATPTDEDALKKYCKTDHGVSYISGVGHYPMIEKPKEFNDLLRRKIKQIANN